MRTGKLIVIEGGDGTGKTVQAGMLLERLRLENPERQFLSADFPRYDNESSFAVRRFLRKNGSRGYRPEFSDDWFGPSLAYAMDRMDAANSLDDTNLNDFLEQGGIVISNRYTQSNIGYQGSKIKDQAERRKFVDTIYDLEYEKLLIPRPDLVLFLDLPANLSREAKLNQLAQKGEEPDALESEPETFFRSRAAYHEVAAWFPGEWKIINCMMPGEFQRKTVQEVSEEIYQAVLPLLS